MNFVSRKFSSRSYNSCVLIATPITARAVTSQRNFHRIRDTVKKLLFFNTNEKATQTNIVDMTSTNTPTAATLKLQQTLVEKGHGALGWDSLWKDGATPWNLSFHAPPLQEVFDTKLVKNYSPNASATVGRALVPGCGQVL